MTGKKGVFGSLKEALFDDVPDVPGKGVPPVSRNTPIPAAPIGAFPTSTPQAPFAFGSAVAVADPAAVEKLEAKVQGSMPESYRKFLEQYESLRDIIPDEGTRFKAALRTSTISIAEIASAIQQALSVLDSTLVVFQKKADDTIAQKQAEAQQQLDADQKLIHDGEAQVAVIQKQLVDVRARVEHGQQAAQAEVARVTAVRQGFQAAHAQVVGRLNAQKASLSNQKV